MTILAAEVLQLFRTLVCGLRRAHFGLAGETVRLKGVSAFSGSVVP